MPSDRNETCPTWTFASAYEYLQSLPRHAWTKGYRVRVLDVLSRIVQAPDTPPKWDDVWFTCFKNCGDGSLAEAKRLLSLHDAAPALIAAARERDELRDRAEKAERERDEARETNRRLNRRCQRSEALPKFHELGLADELRSAVWHLRYRYRCAASAARSIERMWADNSASHYANLIREWAGKGRPPNHTLSHFDSIVDEMRADKAALAAATSRAEKAEKERDEAATAAKVKADLLATATAALGDATARAERAEAEMRKREERA